MKKIVQASLIALALGGVTAMTGISTHAYASEVSVQFNSGDVAFGYTDGYWDRDHHWHEWAREADREAYRKAHNAQYHEWKHDRDKDMGWHELPR